MSRKELAVAIFLSVLTISTSGLIILYGIAVIGMEGVSFSTVLLGAPSVVYGVATLAVIAWAWLGGGEMAIRFITPMAIVYLSVFVFLSMDAGLVIGFQVTVILGVALVLCLHWLSVHYVGKRRITV